MTAASWWHPRRLARAARPHALFLVIVGIGIVLRILAQVAYLPALFYNDSYRYLFNTSLDPTGIWPIGYPALLRPLLWLNNLAVIPLLQHLLALALGVVLYVLMVRWSVPRWLAALATVPVLLDAYQLHGEQQIMPETFFQVLVVGALVLLVWRARPSLRAAAAAGFLLGVAVAVRMVGQALIVPAAVGILVGVPGWRSALKRVGVLAIAFLVPLAAYAGWYHHVGGEYRLSPDWLTTRMLYARVARFVDCDQLDVPPSEQGLCPTAAQQRTMVTDDFNWGATSPLNTFKPPPGADRYALVADFVERAIRAQPLDYAAAVGRDLAKSFAWTKTTFRFDQPVERWRFDTTQPDFPPGPQATVDRFGGPGPSINTSLARLLRGYQLSVGYVPPTFLGIALLAGIAGAVEAWRRGDRARAGLVLHFALAGVVLIVLPANYQFSWRYQVPTFPLLPVAGAVGGTVLARAWRDRHRGAPSASPPSTVTSPEEPHR